MIEYFPFPILELEYVNICYTNQLNRSELPCQTEPKEESQRERKRERESSLIKILQHVPEPSTAVETVGMESLQVQEESMKAVEPLLPSDGSRWSLAVPEIQQVSSALQPQPLREDI